MPNYRWLALLLWPSALMAQSRDEDCFRVNSAPAIMDAISTREEDKTEGPNFFVFQTEMQKAACADPTKDSEEEVRRKVQLMVTRHWNDLQSNNFACGRCTILESAVYLEFTPFIDDAVELQLPLNLLHNDKTILDFIEHERNRMWTREESEATIARIRLLDAHYYILRNAGARHFRELPNGRDSAPPNVEGTWRGSLVVSRRTQQAFPMEISFRCPNGVCDGELSIPALGLSRVRLTEVSSVGTQLGITLNHAGLERYLGFTMSESGDHSIGAYRDANMGPDSLYGFEIWHVGGATHWSSRQELWARNMNGFVGEWVSDGQYKERPRMMSLRLSNGQLSGTVRYASSKGEVEEDVVGEMHGERRAVLRSTAYRVVSGTVGKFDLDVWNLDLTFDGRLFGIEGGTPGAGRLIRFNHR